MMYVNVLFVLFGVEMKEKIYDVCECFICTFWMFRKLTLFPTLFTVCCIYLLSIQLTLCFCLIKQPR
jgi:hypothetical protein